MDRPGRGRFFLELCRLHGKLHRSGASFGASLPAALELLSAAAAAEPADFDHWLLCGAACRAGVAAPELPAECGAGVRVCLLAIRMAALAGLGPREQVALGLAGLLQALGCERLAEERLYHPGGAEIPAQTLRWMEACLERLDGTGPLGLSAADLDEPSRLLAVATAFEALASAAPTRGSAAPTCGSAGEPHRSLAAIISDPARFSAEAAARLAEAVSAFPIGTWVLLTDGRRAPVVGAQPGAPMRPVVALRAPGRASGELPLRLPLEELPGLAVRGLADDPLAPGPVMNESWAAWLARLGAAEGGPPRQPAEVRGRLRAAFVMGEAALTRADLGRRVAAVLALRALTLAAGRVDKAPGVRRRIGERARALERSEREQAELRERELGEIEERFRVALAAPDPELETLRREYADELRARKEAERELLRAREERTRLQGSWDEAMADIRESSAQLRRRRREARQRRAAWLAEKEELERRHLKALEAARARRDATAARLRRKLEEARAALGRQAEEAKALQRDLDRWLGSKLGRGAAAASESERLQTGWALDRKLLRDLRGPVDALAALESQIRAARGRLAQAEAALEGDLATLVQERKAVGDAFREAREGLGKAPGLAELLRELKWARGQLRGLKALRSRWQAARERWSAAGRAAHLDSVSLPVRLRLQGELNKRSLELSALEQGLGELQEWVRLLSRELSDEPASAAGSGEPEGGGRGSGHGRAGPGLGGP